MRKFRVLLCLLLIGCTLCACTQMRAMTGEQTVTVNDLTITLPGYFENQLSQTLSVDNTFMYGIYDISVTGVREDFSLFDQVPTLEEYTQMLLTGNHLDSIPYQEDGLTLFIYSVENSGHSFTYLTAVYEGSSSFWLVQAGCKSSEFESSRNNFQTYLKSVIIQ